MSEASSSPSQPRPGSKPSAPSASHYAVELPYAEELQTMLEGRYIVESFLGQGGMGAVYKGKQLPLKRPVAIKILAKQQSGVEDEFEFEERFKREAYAMAALTHPNIVQVYDCGDAGEHFLFISMELVEGGDLSEMIKVGGVTPEVALGMIGSICDGLQAAHDRGLVHRDIKPANIFLTADGKPKVADFGLAKKFDVKSTFMTKTGLGMGTPDYAAPEQYEGVADIDHRADVYALGVMFYQMLTGTLPRGAYKAPSQRVAVDPRLDDVVAKAMEQDRSERYQSVAALKADVQQILATWMQPPGAGAAPKHAATSNLAATAAAAATPRPGTQRPATRAPLTHAGGPASRPATGTMTTQAPAAKSGMGMILGVLGGIALIAGGAFFLMKKGDAPAPEASSTTSSTTASNSGSSSSSPSPPSSTPAASSTPVGGSRPSTGPAFSNFVPTARWRDGFAPPEKWNSGWQKVGDEMHFPGDTGNRMHLFTEKAANSAVRVRFRAGSTEIKGRAYVDTILRVQSTRGGACYLSTLWLQENSGSGIDIIPPQDQGPRHNLTRHTEKTTVKPGEVHTAELYAIGEELTYFFDGRKLGTARDATLKEGHPGIAVGVGVQLLSVEMANLDDGAMPALARNSATSTAGSGSTSPPMAVPVNLLANVDVSRDAVGGTWAMTSEGLTCQSTSTALLALHPAPPAEYDFEIEFTIQKGYREVSQIMPLPSGMVMWKMGIAMGEETRFLLGPALDGQSHLDDLKRTEAIVKRPRLKANQRYRSVVEVRRDSVRTLLDGEELLKWTGDQKRLSLMGSFAQARPGSLSLATFNTNVLFHKAELRPVSGSPGMPAAHAAPAVASGSRAPVDNASRKQEEPWTDLLATADLARGSIYEPWTMEGGVLRSPLEPKGPDSPHSHTLFTFPLAKPVPNYDVAYEITREKPGFTVVLGFWRDGQQASFAVDGGAGFSLHNQPEINEERPWLSPGKKHMISLEIREERVRALLDGKLMVDHAGSVVASGDRTFFEKTKGMPPFLSVGVCAGRIAVSAARYREVDIAAERLAALVGTHPKLAQLESSYQARHEADAQKPYLAAVAALGHSYLTNGIPRARAAAQAQGNAAVVAALDAEKAALEAGKDVPAVDAADTPAELKSLRATYRATLAKHEAKREADAAPLREIYLKALDAYISELTKAGKIEEASQVKAVRDAKAEPPAARKSPSAQTVQATPAATASASDGWISLLDRIDPVAHMTSGKWSRSPNGLLAEGAGSGPAGYNVLQLPFDPPAEYDFRVAFSAGRGRVEMHQVLYALGRELVFTNAGGSPPSAGFSCEKESSPRREMPGLSTGQRNECLVEVRSDRLTGYVNGQQVAEWKPDPSSLPRARPQRLRELGKIGIGCWSNDTTVLDISVRAAKASGS